MMAQCEAGAAAFHMLVAFRASYISLSFVDCEIQPSGTGF